MNNPIPVPTMTADELYARNAASIEYGAPKLGQSRRPEKEKRPETSGVSGALSLDYTSFGLHATEHFPISKIDTADSVERWYGSIGGVVEAFGHRSGYVETCSVLADAITISVMEAIESGGFSSPEKRMLFDVDVAGDVFMRIDRRWVADELGISSYRYYESMKMLVLSGVVSFRQFGKAEGGVLDFKNQRWYGIGEDNPSLAAYRYLLRESPIDPVEFDTPYQDIMSTINHGPGHRSYRRGDALYVSDYIERKTLSESASGREKRNGRKTQNTVKNTSQNITRNTLFKVINVKEDQRRERVPNGTRSQFSDCLEDVKPKTKKAPAAPSSGVGDDPEDRIREVAESVSRNPLSTVGERMLAECVLSLKDCQSTSRELIEINSKRMDVLDEDQRSVEETVLSYGNTPLCTSHHDETGIIGGKHGSRKSNNRRAHNPNRRKFAVRHEKALADSIVDSVYRNPHNTPYSVPRFKGLAKYCVESWDAMCRSRGNGDDGRFRANASRAMPHREDQEAMCLPTIVSCWNLLKARLGVGSVSEDERLTPEEFSEAFKRLVMWLEPCRPGSEGGNPVDGWTLGRSGDPVVSDVLAHIDAENRRDSERKRSNFGIGSEPDRMRGLSCPTQWKYPSSFVRCLIGGLEPYESQFEDDDSIRRDLGLAYVDKLEELVFEIRGERLGQAVK